MKVAVSSDSGTRQTAAVSSRQVRLCSPSSRPVSHTGNTEDIRRTLFSHPISRTRRTVLWTLKSGARSREYPIFWKATASP